MTLLQLVRSVAGLASGHMNRPHLVVAERAAFSQPWQVLPQPPSQPISSNPGHVQVVREGMIDTMRPGGTGYQAAIGAPYSIAGKTGTAQVASRKGRLPLIRATYQCICVIVRYSLVLLLLIIRRLRLRLRSRAAGMVLALLHPLHARFLMLGC